MPDHDPNFLKFTQAFQANDHKTAMQAFTDLHGEIDAVVTAESLEKQFIRPVLDHNLLADPIWFMVIKNVELMVLINALKTHHECRFDCQDALALGRAGLREMGNYAFMRSHNAADEFDKLYEAELAFGKPLGLSSLLLFARYQNPVNSLKSFCYLYLKQPLSHLPYNCQRSVDENFVFATFAGKLNKPEMLIGLDKVLSECKSTPAARKASLALDLLQAVEPDHKEAILPVLRQQLGESLFKKAQTLNTRPGRDETLSKKYDAAEALEPAM